MMRFGLLVSSYHGTTSPGGDPHINHVRLLMPLNNTIDDLIGNAVTSTGTIIYSSTADPEIDAANFSASAYLRNAYNSSEIGLQDFTVEFFAKVDYERGVMYSSGTSAAYIGGLHYLFWAPGNFGLSISGGTNAWFSAPGIVGDGLYHHFASVREAGVLMEYLDGTLMRSAADATPVTLAAEFFLGHTPVDVWGSYNTTTDIAMHDMRVTVGVARYTANFTPPDAPFPDY